MDTFQIHDDSTAYEDRLVDDLELVNDALRTQSLNVKELSWSLSKIQAIIDLLEPLRFVDTLDCRCLMTIANKLGKIGRKLDLTGSESTPSVLRHLLGTCYLAHHIVVSGGIVHLIEAVGDDGNQYVRDADLMYSDEHGSFQVDYTNSNGIGSLSPCLLTDKTDKVRSKLQKLSMCLEKGFEPRVMSYGVPKDYFLFKVIVPINRNSPREQDFAFVDKLIPIVHRTTWPEATHCLQLYANKVKMWSKEVETMIEGPKLWIGPDEAHTLIKTSCINSKSSAHVHDRFLSKLDEFRANHPEAKPRIDRFYPIDTVRRYEAQESKKLCPLPPFTRGMQHSCPFDRLSEIIDQQKLLGEEPLLFWKMMLACKEKDSVSGKSVSTGNERDYAYMAGCVMRRAKTKKGESVKAVHLMFPAGKGFNGLREALKETADYDKTPLNHANLEEEFNKVCKISQYKGPGSAILDRLSLEVEDIGEPCDVIEKTKGFMKMLIKKNTTHLMSQLSQLQEVTLAILASKEKCKLIKGNKGNVAVKQKGGHITLSIESVSDLNAVVVNNIGPFEGNNVGDISYMVTGLEVTSHAYTYPFRNGSSRILSMSRPQLDWNVLLTHKALSWMSMNYENAAAGRMENTDINVPRLPLFLMFVNSNKFSQASESIRYIFVNGISLSTGPKDLLDKISWYTPGTNLEQLYMLRMMKLMSVLSAAKAVAKPSSIKTKIITNIGGVEQSDYRYVLSQWNIAMPDDERTPLNEQALFDSFYVCKALTIQRYSKLTSEALVLEKQHAARLLYMTIKELNLKHEGRALIKIKHDDLLSYLQESIPHLNQAQPFSPSPIITALGVVATSLRLKKENDTTVGDTISRVYKPLTETTWTCNISDVMNNRGSVANTGVNGLGVTVSVVEKGKVVRKHQNARCYTTILQAMSDMVNGIPPPKDVDWANAAVEACEEIGTIDLKSVSHLSDKLWPLMVYFSSNFAACVSKMVHKDQLGAREIAVLNAAARVMCRFTEMLARAIRDLEHGEGVTTNLIERRDKMEHIKRALNQSNALRKAGKNILYDSADCSKWGPSMMMHTLYLSIGSRVTSSVHRSHVRNCYSLFGNKVFKIPDEFYLNMDKFQGGKTMKAKVADLLRNMPIGMGDLKKQIFYLEESMHQGICGCASSTMGADAHNLSDYVTDFVLRPYNLKTTTFLTSDDYGRVLVWDRGEEGIFSIGKKNLAMHYVVMLHSGIKRNLIKSGLSDCYWEFNSEFLCPTGEIRPDIKSRLSYIDYCMKQDPYEIASRAMSQAAEFLRVEGSYLGACWTFVLCNDLAMIQNQSVNLFKRLGPSIYDVPLELGGLIKPDVLKATVTSTHFPILQNYKFGQDLTSKEALNVMMSYQPSVPKLIMSDENEEHVKIPSFSRSSVVSLTRRATRRQRAIQEFLMSLDPLEYNHVVFNYSEGSLITALMACTKREAAEGFDDGSAMMLSMSMTPRHTKCFKVPESKIGIQEGLYSRRELHDIAVNLLETFAYDPLNEEHNAIDVDSWDLIWDQNVKVLKSMTFVSLSMAPRHMRTMRFRQKYAHPTFVKDCVREYEEKFLPGDFGGVTDIHPWAYLENKILYAERMKKVSERKQDFRMALRDLDDDKCHWCQRIFLSNYAGGTRMKFLSGGKFSRTNVPVHLLDKAIALGTEFRTLADGSTIDLLSPSVTVLASNNAISKIDITTFANALVGADESVLLEQSKIQQLLFLLKYWSEKKQVSMVVRPGQLSTSFNERMYKSMSKTEVWMKPMRNHNGTAGRDIIVRRGESYIHNLVSTRSTLICPEDTLTDQYRELDISERETVDVEVTGLYGFTVIKQVQTMTLLQVLSQIDLKAHRYVLCTKRGLNADKDVLFRTNIPDALVGLDTDKRVLLDMVMGFRISIGETEELKDVELSSESDDESIQGFGDSDSELSDFDSDVDEELLAIMDAHNKVNCEVKAADDDDSEGEGEEDDSEEWGRALSDTGLVRPSSVQYETFKTHAMVEKGISIVRAARQRFNADINQVYELLLPFKLPVRQNIVQVGDSHPLVALLDSVDLSDLDDKDWAKEYIRHSVAHFPPVKSYLQTLERAELDSSLLPIEEDFFNQSDSDSDGYHSD